MNKKIYSSMSFLFFFLLMITTAQSFTKISFQHEEYREDLRLLSQKNLKEHTLFAHTDTAFIEATGDDLDSISPSTTVSVKQRQNNPPYVPHDPIPGNGSLNVYIVIYLLWIGGDPDQEDVVTYDVYFGTSNPPPKVVSNQSSNSYIPGILEYSRSYYWKVVSWDNNGAWSIGPLWHFSTILDTTQPFTTHILQGNMGQDDWYISDVIVTLDALDNQSGVNHTYYTLGSGSWLEYNGSLVVDIDAIHTLEYYSVDTAGNIEPVKGPFPFKIDQTQPSLTFTKQQINLFEVKFIAEASDATSGMNYIWFALDGVLQSNDSQAPYEWIWNGAGNHTVIVIVFDVAGNANNQSMSTPAEKIQWFNTIDDQTIEYTMVESSGKQRGY